MASGINKVILIGNLGADPEVRYTQNGQPIANLSIATSEQWKDKHSGETQTKTEWHRVVIFGKLAEIVQQYTKKGSKIYLEGKLQTRKWKDQQNQDRYTTEVVVDTFGGTLQLLDKKETSKDYQAPETDNRSNYSSPANEQYTKRDASYSSNFSENQNPKKDNQNSLYDEFYDDIPF